MWHEITTVILALDGLDYDLVERLDLKNLKQMKYGRLEVPINKILKQPSSPEVWASFLCGKHVVMMFKGRKRLRLMKFLIKMKRLLPFISLGIGRKTTGGITGFGKLEEKSWAENENVLTIGVPYFDYTNEVFEAQAEFAETKDLVKLKMIILKDYLKKSKLAIKSLKNIDVNKYKIVFVYLHYPDQINHLCFNDMEQVEAFYQALDTYAKKFASVVRNHHLLIISDHGANFKTGGHSQMGFISSNNGIKLPKSIIELGKNLWEKV